MSTIGFVTFESVSQFPGPPKNAGYTTELEMGISVGVVGNTDGGGTIGGYLREKSQHDRIFAVTAHHVVSQGRVKISRSDNVQVESPAGIDLEQNDLEATRAGNRIVGTVFASSGLRTVEWDRSKCHDYSSSIPDGSELSMDWALIELNGPRLATNSSHLYPNDHITKGALGYAIVANGTEVHKVGRITGFTDGITDGLTTANLDKGAPSSLEMTASNLNTGFSLPGDSGAWILNEQGQVLGMIIAGIGNGLITYYTPIILMLDDMENHTGLKLEVMP